MADIRISTASVLMTPPRSSGKASSSDALRPRDFSVDSDTVPRLTHSALSTSRDSDASPVDGVDGSTSGLVAATSSAVSLASFPQPPSTTTPPDSPTLKRTSNNDSTISPAGTIVNVRGVSFELVSPIVNPLLGCETDSSDTDRESGMPASPKALEQHYLKSLQAVSQHLPVSGLAPSPFPRDASSGGIPFSASTSTITTRNSTQSHSPVAPLNFSHKRTVSSLPTPPLTGQLSSHAGSRSTPRSVLLTPVSMPSSPEYAWSTLASSHRKTMSQPLGLADSETVPLQYSADDAVRQPSSRRGHLLRPTLPTIDSDVLPTNLDAYDSHDDESVYNEGVDNTRISMDSSFKHNPASILDIDFDLYTYGFSDSPPAGERSSENRDVHADNTARPTLGSRHNTLADIVQIYGGDYDEAPIRPPSGASQFDFAAARRSNPLGISLQVAPPPEISLPIPPTDSEIELLQPTYKRASHSGSLSSYADSQQLLRADQSSAQGSDDSRPSNRLLRAAKKDELRPRSWTSLKTDSRPLSELSGSLSGSVMLLGEDGTIEDTIPIQLDSRRNAWVAGASPLVHRFSDANEKSLDLPTIIDTEAVSLSAVDAAIDSAYPSLNSTPELPAWQTPRSPNEPIIEATLERTPPSEEKGYFAIPIHPADERYKHVYRKRHVHSGEMLVPEYSFPPGSSFPNRNALSPPLTLPISPFRLYQHPEPLNDHVHPFRSPPEITAQRAELIANFPEPVDGASRPPLLSSFSSWTKASSPAPLSPTRLSPVSSEGSEHGSWRSSARFVSVGPLLNVTGTPQGTGMRLVGSSPADVSTFVYPSSPPAESPVPERRNSKLAPGSMYQQIRLQQDKRHESYNLADLPPPVPEILMQPPLLSKPAIQRPLTVHPPRSIAHFKTPPLPPLPTEKPTILRKRLRSSGDYDAEVEERAKRVSRLIFAVCLLFPPLLLLLGYGGLDVLIAELTSHHVLAIRPSEKRVARIAGWTFCGLVIVGFIVGLIIISVR